MFLPLTSGYLAKLYIVLETFYFNNADALRDFVVISFEKWNLKGDFHMFYK